ncbi:hypothetical protein [Sinomicrobium sp. M5D2P17]
MKNNICAYGKIHLLLIVFLLVVISCDRNRKPDSKKIIDINEQKNKNIEEFVVIDFPDTVTLGQGLILGKLWYNLVSRLDTIRPSNIDKRYVFLHIAIDPKEDFISLEEIKKTEHFIYEDTLGHGYFSFEAVFTKPGNNLLNGVVEDIIIQKGEDKDGNVKMRTNETLISKNVFVKDTIH